MKEIIKLCKDEIKKVTGCTEPASISFTFAQASYILKEKTSIKEFNNHINAKISLSQDVYRNASTVKIPFLQLKGIKPAVAYGIYNPSVSFDAFAQIGHKEKKKILNLITRPLWLEIIPLKKRGIYIKGELKKGKDFVQIIIEGKHDSIKKIILNNRIIFTKKKEKIIQIKNLSEIKKIVKKGDKDLESLARDFIIKQGKWYEKYGFKNTLEAVEKLTEKRMEGEAISIVTITGSGNQGILLALPFYEIYKKAGDKIISSTIFSILTQIYLTQKEGRISDLCGLANKTAPALIAGLSYYHNKNLTEIKKKMNLVKEILKGLLCEGAKKSCALKAYLALNTVFKVLFN